MAEIDLGSPSAIRRLSVSEIGNLNKNYMKKAMLTLLNKESEKINKAEMKKALFALLKMEKSTDSSSETTSALDKIQQSMSTVEQQLSTLQNQVLDFETKLNMKTSPDQNDALTGTAANDFTLVTRGKSLSGVMRQSVGAALQEERCRQDVIVTRACESNDDTKMIKRLMQSA